MRVIRPSCLNRVWLPCLASAAAVSLMSAKAEATTFSFQPVNFPNDNFTQLLGINDAGKIAGYHGAGLPNSNPNKGFTLTLPNTTSFTDENFPNSTQTQVVGINNLGNTDGFYTIGQGTASSPLNTFGFTDINGQFTAVVASKTASGATGTAFNQLLGLNNNGMVAGYSSTDTTGMTLQQAYIASLSNKNNNGTFNVTYIPVNNGTQNSQATNINDNGLVSGFYFDTNGVSHGFEYNINTPNTPIQTIDFPGATFTQSLGINNLGQLDGIYMDAAGNMHGFIDTNGVFQSVDEPLAINNGLTTTTINGINNHDQIVGFFVDSTGATQGFVGTPVPESGLGPVSLSLLAGVGVLTVKGVRRKAKPQIS